MYGYDTKVNHRRRITCGTCRKKLWFSYLCRIFFLGRGALQDVCREWPTSRFAAVYTLNPENPTPTPKDTARTLNKQCAACYSRISGSMSAHLAQVKNRSCQRVARIRIYMGKFTQGWPVPPRGKKKSAAQVVLILNATSSVPDSPHISTEAA